MAGSQGRGRRSERHHQEETARGARRGFQRDLARNETGRGACPDCRGCSGQTDGGRTLDGVANAGRARARGADRLKEELCSRASLLRGVRHAVTSCPRFW